MNKLADEICLVPGGGLACAVMKMVNNNKSAFQDDVESETQPAVPESNERKIATIMMHILNVCLLIAALYLSFKCNKGFNFVSVLAAVCCSPCYIAYRLALPCK
jgi:hypothetical protein